MDWTQNNKELEVYARRYRQIWCLSRLNQAASCHINFFTFQLRPTLSRMTATTAPCWLNTGVPPLPGQTGTEG